MTVTLTQPDDVLKRRGLQVFASIAAAHFLVDCYGAVFPMFKYLVGLDPAKAGMIATFAMFCGPSLQPIFGAWADHGHQRRLVVMGTAMVAASMLMGPVGLHMESLGLWLTYGSLFVLLLTVRIGQAMYHPAAASLVGNSAGDRRTTMLSIFIAVGMVGFASGQPLFGLVYNRLAGHTEWMLIPAALFVAAAALWCRPVQSAEARRVDLGAILRGLGAVRGRLLVLFLIQTLTSGVGLGVFFLMPEFLESRGYPAVMVWGGGAFLWVFGSALFMMPVGYLADRFGPRRVMFFTLGLAAVAYYLFWGMPTLSAPLCALALLLGGGLVGAVNPVGVSLGQQLAPQHASVISGLLMGLAWSFGASSQWLVGWLSKFPTLEFSGALGILGLALAPAFLLSGVLLLDRSEKHH